MLRRPAPVGLLLLFAACSSGGDDHRGGAGPDAGDPAGPDAGDPAELVQCPDPVPAAADGACEVTPGGAAVFLRGTVLAADAVYAAGGVLIEDGAISCTGCECAEAAEAAGATRIDCAGAV